MVYHKDMDSINGKIKVYIKETLNKDYDTVLVFGRKNNMVIAKNIKVTIC